MSDLKKRSRPSAPTPDDLARRKEKDVKRRLADATAECLELRRSVGEFTAKVSSLKQRLADVGVIVDDDASPLPQGGGVDSNDPLVRASTERHLLKCQSQGLRFKVRQLESLLQEQPQSPQFVTWERTPDRRHAVTVDREASSRTQIAANSSFRDHERDSHLEGVDAHVLEDHTTLQQQLAETQAAQQGRDDARAHHDLERDFNHLEGAHARLLEDHTITQRQLESANNRIIIFQRERDDVRAQLQQRQATQPPVPIQELVRQFSCMIREPRSN
jgi:hypothetical protein